MMFEKRTSEEKECAIKIYKVSIYLKDERYPNTGWLLGKTAAEVANKVCCQTTVLLVPTWEKLEEVGYNMSEVQEIDGYNSSEIVKFCVSEYGVVPCSIK